MDFTQVRGNQQDRQTGDKWFAGGPGIHWFCLTLSTKMEKQEITPKLTKSVVVKDSGDVELHPCKYLKVCMTNCGFLSYHRCSRHPLHQCNNLWQQQWQLSQKMDTVRKQLSFLIPCCINTLISSVARSRMTLALSTTAYYNWPKWECGHISTPSTFSVMGLQNISRTGFFSGAYCSLHQNLEKKYIYVTGHRIMEKADVIHILEF
jgi:hypothetical protein